MTHETTAPVQSINDDMLRELEVKANAATPGPWFQHDDKGRRYVETMTDEVICQVFKATERERADGDYIASANPSVMLSMISAIRRQQAMLAKQAAPVAVPFGFSASVADAERAAREVFSDSCNHTRQAIEYMAEYLLAAAQTPPTGQREIQATTSDELRARCAEILGWQKSGVLNGDALRSYAKTKWYAEEHNCLQIAESDTAREAYALITAAPTPPASTDSAAQGYDCLCGIEWKAQGDANKYIMLRGNDWVSEIQFNGCLLPAEHEEILKAMLSDKTVRYGSGFHDGYWKGRSDMAAEERDSMPTPPAQQPAGHFVRRSGFGPHVEVAPTEVGSFPLYAAPPAQRSQYVPTIAPSSDDIKRIVVGICEELYPIETQIEWNEEDDRFYGLFASKLIDMIYAAPGDTAAPELGDLGCDYRGSHFGAPYPDAQCVDGYLWDEDSCDEPGGPLLVGGDIPCPKCNAGDLRDPAAPEQDAVKVHIHERWAEVESICWRIFEDGKSDYRGCTKERLEDLRALLEGGK